VVALSGSTGEVTNLLVKRRVYLHMACVNGERVRLKFTCLLVGAPDRLFLSKDSSENFDGEREGRGCDSRFWISDQLFDFPFA
jgi:hypothetical protein